MSLEERKEIFIKHEKHLEAFEQFANERNIDYGYKKTYPPKSFMGSTHNMTVFDTEVGMYAVDDSMKVYKVNIDDTLTEC